MCHLKHLFNAQPTFRGRELPEPVTERTQARDIALLGLMLQLAMAISSPVSCWWGWRLGLNAQVGAGDMPGACAARKLERGLMQKAKTLERQPQSLKMGLESSRKGVMSPLLRVLSGI